jgi:hypothetical protein
MSRQRNFGMTPAELRNAHNHPGKKRFAPMPTAPDKPQQAEQETSAIALFKTTGHAPRSRQPSF